MLAWNAITTGEAAVTGDLSADFPGSGAKLYKSILVLPIHGMGCVLGAVSIDSVRDHHFDLEWSELERALAPYVCVLGWTLKENVVRLNAAEKAAVGGEP